MRLLAEAPFRLWMAVSGTLGAITQRQLRQRLHEQVLDGHREFFLDMQGLRCADGLPDDELHTLFPEDPAAHFHLIGAPDSIRECVAGDPRFTLYAGPESAWCQWVSST
ncbi:hypothetical protein G5C60_08795 [Streptomyces sp. HC44]|uniref:Uncharacterized protein n=1 Tax=Streptomyces scabichelini TaxID=2711217 RepID=A0A6G4V1H5_9ACTN|nr:hypothetical protein [Streptomyces scabichelini]NGO07750.1 hypothetical protein [Streptomyces scabichelini]